MHIDEDAKQTVINLIDAMIAKQRMTSVLTPVGAQP